MSWNTWRVKVKALTPGVVVNFRNAGFGGSSHPKNNLKKIILKSTNQKN